MKLTLAFTFALGFTFCTVMGETEEELWESVISGPDKDPLLGEELGDQNVS